MATRRCPACGGVNLTTPGQLEASSHSLHRQFDLNDGSWLGGTLLVHVEGVICGDCGHVALFAKPEDLVQLRARWPQLK